LLTTQRTAAPSPADGVVEMLCEESQTGSVSVASSSFMAAASFSHARRRQNGSIRQLAGIVGKREEDLLRDILGQTGVVTRRNAAE
jgi:hypothetical protein